MADDADAVRRLLDAGGLAIDATDEHGWSALFWAVGGSEGGLRAARALLERGASVDLPDCCGWTPLFWCVDHQPGGSESHQRMARLLLEFGATADATDHEGKTPLMWARAYENVPMAALLEAAERGGESSVVELQLG